jgi:hypothetical protein
VSAAELAEVAVAVGEQMGGLRKELGSGATAV